MREWVGYAAAAVYRINDPVGYIRNDSKCKVLLRIGHEGPEEELMYSCTLPSTLALDGYGWSTPRPGRFNPREDSVPIV